MIGAMGRVVTAGVATLALVCVAAAFAERSTATTVYESIAPAVVFVETDGGTGSGLLLDSNTVLTAAHLVYPHRSARIVFPHGTELLEVPVIGWDLMADVAVLGPIEADPLPAIPSFDLTEGLAIGADLFAIGYPGEVESFPQPTISRGILSRYRRWSDQEVTYLQTDAALDAGQSGGVLASAAGAVVGMTLYSPTVTVTSAWRCRWPTCCRGWLPCWRERPRHNLVTAVGRGCRNPHLYTSIWKIIGPCRRS